MRKIMTVVLMLSLLCSLSACGGGGEELSLISCPEQGFTTRTDPSYLWVTDETDGLYIYLEDKGSIPYVHISWFDDVSSVDEARDYLSETIRPAIQEGHDGPFQAAESSERKIGGKKLPAGEYTYQEQGQEVVMLLAIDPSDKHTVVYQAKYRSGKGEETLKALDNAVRNFKAGDKPKAKNAAPNLLDDQGTDGSQSGDETQSGGTQSGGAQSGGTQSGGVSQTQNAGTQGGNSGQSGTTQSASDDLADAGFEIVLAESRTVEYENYNDGLLSMDIPKGWKVIPHPQMMDAVHYTFQVVDPDNADYQIFFNMKWELGNISSESERQWYAKNYGPYAGDYDFSKYPVIDPQNTQGVFQVWNENWTAFGGLKSGNFTVPSINQFTVIETLGTQPIVGGDIVRASYQNADGNAVEGIFTASPHKLSMYYINLVVVYNTMFITAPADDFVNWEPVLNHCVSTIRFSDTFTSNFMSQESTIAANNSEISRICGETSDIITEGWAARQSTYDIASQKQSDATLGYERVYDTETNEIYRAYNGFSDDYAGSRYQPATDDMYASPIDGYIEH